MNLGTLMACAICTWDLTEHRSGGRVRYRHPVSDGGERHAPVPVPASDLTEFRHRCHLCHGDYPVWNYRTNEIGAHFTDGNQHLVRTYNTQWHVCLRCTQFIEAGDSDGLAVHTVTSLRWHRSLSHLEIATIQAVLQTITRSHRGRALLTTTAWPPASIRPEMLPKIRDRLTGLLRGPADLPEALNHPDTRQTLANHLDHVPLYWINDKFTAQVNDVTDEQPPAHITDRITPAPGGFVAWPQPVGRDGLLAAVSWTPQADGWHLVCYRGVGGGLADDLMPVLRHDLGWLVPIHTEHITTDTPVDGRHPVGPLVTTWLLMNQHMAEAVPAQLPKAVIRAHQRRQRPAPDVRLVHLKAPTTTPAEPSVSGTRSRATPDHRYWVTAHPRNQAHGPGRSLRKRIDIEPFLKGPLDAPIRLSTTVRALGKRQHPEPENRPSSD
ncbi:hypothetical protein C1I95_19210 [Micromonospora craterilacus]|uniref:Uncharacterized protein n=1 Tax=Micromonospora craterilacus TaxID=1655439 RepID=A0A2W2DYT4_9ACTN|nr:hypothetical protein C1I95_19210 [Micromonospora craterilacus]